MMHIDQLFWGFEGPKQFWKAFRVRVFSDGGGGVIPALACLLLAGLSAGHSVKQLWRIW